MNGYSYDGLKTWTGKKTAYGAYYETPEDYWNPHSLQFECIFNDKYFSFKPDLVGWQDKRAQVEIQTPWFGDSIELYFDKFNEEWVERAPGRGDYKYDTLWESKLPYELLGLLRASIKKSYGWDPKVMEEHL